jgi:hypothetical protein
MLDRADSCPDREAWFGARKPGSGWEKAGICIVLGVHTLDAVICEAMERRPNMPDPIFRELYQDHEEFSARGVFAIRLPFDLPPLMQFRGVVARVDKERLTPSGGKHRSYIGILGTPHLKILLAVSLSPNPMFHCPSARRRRFCL